MDLYSLFGRTSLLQVFLYPLIVFVLSAMIGYLLIRLINLVKRSKGNSNSKETKTPVQ